jgi:hypothetical protein
MGSTRSQLARRFGLLSAVVLLAGTTERVATQQAASPAVSGTYRGVGTAVQFDVSPPLRELALREPAERTGVENERFDDPPSGLEGPLGPQDIDPIVQREVGGGREIAAAGVNFDGMSQSSGPYPPDPNGDVGPNHYVQMVNSRYAVYNKTGTLLAGPANINTLWSGFGGPCQTENAGDPVVLYDQFADRWLLTQFTAAGPSYYNCVALSTSADPTGTYYRWAFSTGTNFPDYPKYGIWSDAYYISTREFLNTGPFAGVGAYALNKTQMIAGNASPQVISFLAPPSPSYTVGDGLLPTDLDGTTLPPGGTPEFFIGSQDNGGAYSAPSDALNIWKFTTNFTTPASSSFVLANAVIVTAFDSVLDACGGGRSCVPQPGTSVKLDHQGYRQRVLHRAAYRNFGSYESIVTNQSVEVPTAMSGIRWWEIRSPNSSPTIFQEGTYAPGTSDGVHRWFGSIAQDKLGDMALGYSASDGSITYPSVRYTGRLVGDTAGTMPQGEGSLVAGGGSQTGTANRWGDYSSMNVDPTDDCTFWYTTEYYAATSLTGWRTRIGTIKFSNCTGSASAPAFWLQPSDQNVSAGQNAQFSCMATGDPNPDYQWQVSTNAGASWSNLSNTAPYSGVTTTALTVTSVTTALSGYQYRCAAQNNAGSANSSAAKLNLPNALYDSTLKAPKCGTAAASCDAGSLLNGRDSISGGAETNQPNTINSSCADATAGTYHVDESIDKLKVSTVSGGTLTDGKSVKIEATVFVWSTCCDKLSLFYTATASAPSWQLLTTLTPSASGLQTLSTTYTLPIGSLQAIRANFGDSGTTSSACVSSSFDDHDDLIFTVNSFTDDPLTTGTTTIKKVHITELRTRIDAVRAVWNLAAYSWTNATITQQSTIVQAVDIQELRDALNAAYDAASTTRPVYTDPNLAVQSTAVKAVHITELRNAVKAIE